MEYPVIWPQFFTATILKWDHLLSSNSYKDIIIDSLRFMVNDKRIELNAFVIMSNHVHLIWQPLQDHTLTNIQASFLTYTAKAIKKRLSFEDPALLEKHKINKYDRTYQIWKREPLSI
ncbi:MAG: transposase [Ferruginibacter sp.]